ncbi:hypothetical protein PUN28_000151 [Cardiocondyla obscurior]|uniref:Large ribosomal subunit protein mL38 n=1 Tax=Cardiocondyla obscurior TaxID=286306 RepID=A0AAW2GXZ9_9HYME
MSVKLLRYLAADLVPRGQHVRHAHRIRGVPPHLARTLLERLESLNATDPTLDFKVDIGYKAPKLNRRSIISTWQSEIVARKNDPELEKASRTRKLLVDLEKVKNDWLQTDSCSHVYRLAKHYGIYSDLYGDAYFKPVLPLNISYDLEDDKLTRVYYGNVIKPSEASKAPDVTYNAKDGSLWTLIMSTPDGNMTNVDNEYCHWFIGNIPGNQLKKGEELINYLQPIAPYGIGYCRYIFVLYKQKSSIDFSEYKRAKPCLNLEERNWKTVDFYRKYQDYLTPAGLAFFQSDWEPSLKEFYYNTLNMRIPVFRYDFPEPYIKKQVWFPLRQPFNLYLDKYRDPKQINKEFLLRKLKKIHPFNGPEPPKKYPLAHSNKHYIPSWLKFEMIKKRLSYGRVNELDDY